MTDLNLINHLAREKKWNELEKVFSSTISLGEDRDGNPGCISFFKENIPEAIILGEKYHLISQIDIATLIQFSSSSFRKQLVNQLLVCDTIKPLEIFTNKNNYEILSFISNDYFNLVTNYQTDNNKDKFFDMKTVETIFSNKEFCEALRSYPFINSFVLNNSTVETTFLLFNKYSIDNYFISNKFFYILEIIDYWKQNIIEVSSLNFNKNIYIGLEFLKKTYKNPFSSKENTQEIYKIIEYIHNVQLFCDLINKPSTSPKINKHKI